MRLRAHCARHAAAAALAVLLAGCGLGDSEPTTSLVVGWSQAEHPDLQDNDPEHPGLRTRLVTTAGQRDAALSELPTSVSAADRAKVGSVDLTTQVLVLAVYSRCTETSRVTGEGPALRVVVDRDEGTVCAWAPTQVDVWSVEREGLPTPVRLIDQSGDPAPG